MIALPGEETLPLARDWFSGQNEPKRDLAEKILQDRAMPADVPILREALRPMLNSEEAEYGCFMIKAFRHLPNIGVIPELVEIYHQFRFSRARAYAAEAIHVTSPEFFRDKFATECLWDCEEGTRELAAKFAALEIPEARERIRHLAADSFEEKEVREEARSREAEPGCGRIF